MLRDVYISESVCACGSIGDYLRVCVSERASVRRERMCENVYTQDCMFELHRLVVGAEKENIATVLFGYPLIDHK